MKPRGPLMIEHRLIERMLEVVRNQISFIDRTNAIDSVFIDTTVDFIRNLCRPHSPRQGGRYHVQGTCQKEYGL